MEIIGEIGSTEPTQSVRQLDWSQNLDLFIGLGRLGQVQEQFKGKGGSLSSWEAVVNCSCL
jgi:hypothetical protein